MNRSTKTRYAIFQILIEIFKNNNNYENVLNKIIVNLDLNEKDISFVNNVCLNTMRKSIHCKAILKKFVKPDLKVGEFILLSSAIVQIVYLKIKPYAVVNDTVNVAKKVNIFSGFINATLKNITRNLEYVHKTNIDLNYFPKWFVNQIRLTKDVSSDLFIENFHEQPSLHIVFKSKKYLNSFTEPHIKSSNKSAFLDVQKKITNIENFKKGEWWVQDFSSMIPIAINTGIKNLNVLDICSAPGGKAFQLLSKNKVILNDISYKRIKRLRDNLSRLGYDPEIKNINGLDFRENKKFDLIVIDAPCSSIGTIRKHPEILFRNKEPDFKSLNDIQKNLLQKCTRLLKNKGKIIYMVCSFFHSETTEIINNFLNKNKNFSIERFNTNSEFLNIENLISKEGYFATIPTSYNGYKIDGFFSAQLIKND